MEKVTQAFLLLTSIGWPVTFIATAVVVPLVGAAVTVALLMLVLLSIRFFKTLFRQALDAYFAENA